MNTTTPGAEAPADAIDDAGLIDRLTYIDPDASKADLASDASYLLITGISTLKVLADKLTRDSDDLDNAFHGALLLLEKAHASLVAAS